jgi:UDP-2-acetamido-2-deoxy-ribo-hexuluronate aminotransferase
MSDIACTSFFPTKPLGCYGDGGAIFTSNSKLAEAIKSIARHGQSGKYNHIRLGINSRLDTIQAAILLEKLKILDTEINKREKIAQKYNNLFKKYDVHTPNNNTLERSAWGQYTIKCDKRDELKKHLLDLNIPSVIHYPKTVNQQNAYLEKLPNLINSERACKTVLSLPIDAYLNDTEIFTICNSVTEFFVD